jgi:hypothetical protein
MSIDVNKKNQELYIPIDIKNKLLTPTKYQVVKLREKHILTYLIS